MVQKPLEPALLPLTRETLNDDGTKLKFVVDDIQYEYDLNAETLAKLGMPCFGCSPDRLPDLPGRQLQAPKKLS